MVSNLEASLSVNLEKALLEFLDFFLRSKNENSITPETDGN